MQVLVVTFGFKGMAASELEAMSADLAPQFAQIPGCVEKTWLLDRAAGRCGGVYKFVDAASLEAYRMSELWAGVEAIEAFHDFDVRVYDMMEQPSVITGGRPQAVTAG